MVCDKLSVIVPAYNEDNLIYKNLLAIHDSLSRWHGNYTIIAVNDGSADDTMRECTRAAGACPHIRVVSYEENTGKGYALRAGVAAVADEDGYVAFLDADLDLPPEQLEGIFRRMLEENADVIVGSKLHRESKVDYPSSRKFVSFFYYLFIRALFGLKVRDTQTGLKLFKAGCIKPVMEKILVKRYAYDIEVLAICQRRGCRIAQAPVELVFRRSSGFGRIKLADIIRTGWDTLAVFYRLRMLRYYD